MNLSPRIIRVSSRNNDIDRMKSEISDLGSQNNRLKIEIKEATLDLKQIKEQRDYLENEIAKETYTTLRNEKKVQLDSKYIADISDDVKRLRKQSQDLEKVALADKIYKRKKQEYHLTKTEHNKILKDISKLEAFSPDRKELSSSYIDFPAMNDSMERTITTLNDTIDTATIGEKVSNAQHFINLENIFECIDQNQQTINIVAKNIEKSDYNFLMDLVTSLEKCLNGVAVISTEISDDELPSSREEMISLTNSIISSHDNIPILRERKRVMNHEIENLYHILNQTKSQLEQDQIKAERDAIEENGIEIEIEHCEAQISFKRKQIERAQILIAETKKSVGQMNIIKIDTQHEVSDLKQRDKPEVIKLMEDTKQWQLNLSEVSEKLDAAEKEERALREKLEVLKESPGVKEYFKMKAKKDSIERKIAAVKEEIKKQDCDQQDFGAIVEQNEAKYRHLSDSLGKLITQKEEDEKVVKALQAEADFLQAFLRQNRNG